MTNDTGSSAQALLRSVIEAVEVPVIAWDLEGHVLAHNEACTAVLGYTREALDRMTRLALIHPDDRRTVEERMQWRREGDRAAETFEVRLWTGNRRFLRVRARAVPVVDGDRVIGDTVSYAPADQTLEDAVAHQWETYLALFERISDAVWIRDGDGGMEWMNRSAERLHGRTLDVVRQTPIEEILPPAILRGRDSIRAAFSSGGAVPSEVQFTLRRPDGELRAVRGTLLMLRDAHGAHQRSIVIAHDVTETRKREAELRELAARAEQESLIDPLSGLPNRRAFDQAMEAAGESVSEPRFSLLIVDMDDLKQINDRLGHPAGDDAIRAVAQSIKSRIRSDDQVFRIGGDEFAVISHGGNAAILAERLATPMRFREPVPWLTISVGIAEWGEADDLFALADGRMYAHKRSQRERPSPSVGDAASGSAI